MYGLATATTDPSIPTMITPRATLTSVNQGLSVSGPPQGAVPSVASGSVRVRVTHYAMVAESAKFAQFLVSWIGAETGDPWALA